MSGDLGGHAVGPPLPVHLLVKVTPKKARNNGCKIRLRRPVGISVSAVLPVEYCPNQALDLSSAAFGGILQHSHCHHKRRDRLTDLF